MRPARATIAPNSSRPNCWRSMSAKCYWDHLGLKTLSQTWQRLNPAA